MAKDFQADLAAVGRIEAVPKILDIVCRTTGMGFAAVARVTGERWIACAVKDEIAFGLQPGGELQVGTTICREIHQSHEAVVISHVAEDACYRGHPTPAMYGFQSYISVPILLPGGSFFGTLCAIDPRPARLDAPEIVGMFTLFAELIAAHLGAMDRMEAAEASLLGERRTAALREEFIAVLGHDLRNPLAAIDGGLRLIERTPLNDKATRILGMVGKSVARMAGLLDNIMDFAQGRLGGGLALQRDAGRPLLPVLAQIVDEIRVSAPGRVIMTDFRLAEPVDCDHRRIGQLFSHLLGNAVTHGADTAPIRAEAVAAGGRFELSVSNSGAPIPPEVRDRLFQPFTRQQGLGLGLYICAEIARAHGGTLTVSSSTEETRFTFRMSRDSNE